MTKSGDERLVEWRNTLVRDDDGRVVGTLSSGTDVTERTGAAEALRQAEERMRFALQHAKVGVWDMDYATGAHLSQLADTAYVRDVRFSTNGQYLMTGSDDGAAVLWLWKTEDLRAQACERVGRNLTPAEWQRFLGAMPYSATCSGLP